jgi:hypothetical protein
VVEYLRVFHHVGFFCNKGTTMTAPMRTQEVDHSKTEAGRGDKHASTSVDRQAVIEGRHHHLAGNYQARTQFKDHSALVNELRLIGRHVVVATGPAYGPPAGATMGTRICLIGDFATGGEAEALASKEQGYLNAELQIEVLSPITPQGEIQRILAGWDTR